MTIDPLPCVGRVWVVARNTAREALRQRLFQFIGLLGILLICGIQGLRGLNFGTSELKFIADFGFGAIAFFGSMLAIVATSQLFFSEIEHRTVLTLLARPIHRAEFVVGKFLGSLALSACFCALLTGLLMAVLWFRETALMRTTADAFDHGRAVDYAAVLAAGFAQWLKLAILTALTSLVASYARTQLFTTAAGFAILAVCHLQFMVQASAHSAAPVYLRSAVTALSVLFPNFQLFDFSESIAAGDGIAWFAIGRLTIFTAGYAIFTCSLAGIAFRRREF
jgi:ABC-type transport system involved in multi-copper enzyme maturation permease subunit